MRGDSWHREPPWRIRGLDEAATDKWWEWALHDCWIDVEGIRWERPGAERRIASVRFPVALDDEERKRETWPWELVIRRPQRLRIDDGAFIAEYSINAIKAAEDHVAISCHAPLTIEFEVHELDVAVEPRTTDF